MNTEQTTENIFTSINFLCIFFLLFSFEALAVKKLSQQNLSNLNFLFLPIFTHTKVVKSSTTL